MQKKSLKKKNFSKFINFFDYVIECTGNTKLLNSSIKFAKKFGGNLIVIGNYKYQSKFVVDPWQILFGKKILGSWSGQFDYRKKFKMYEKYSRSLNSNLIFGKKVYKLKNFSRAINDFKKSKVIRPLIKIN